MMSLASELVMLIGLLLYIERDLANKATARGFKEREECSLKHALYFMKGA